MRHLYAVHLLKGIDKLKHAHRASCAHIEHLAVLLHLSFHHAGDGIDVCAGKVHNVNVVPLAGAVRGGVVVAEDVKALALPDCGLGDERNKVVGHSAGKFADEGRRMCADRVEVAQKNALQGALGGFYGVPEDILAHGLGVAVRRGCGLSGGVLRYGDYVGLSIYGCRRREQHIAAARLCSGYFQHVQEAFQIVLVVHEGLCHGLSNGLEGGKVDDGVNMIFAEKCFYGLEVAEIHHLQGKVFAAGNLLYAFKASAVAVGEIVGHNYVIACLQQFYSHMAADKSGASGNKNSFFHDVIKIWFYFSSLPLLRAPSRYTFQGAAAPSGTFSPGDAAS